MNQINPGSTDFQVKVRIANPKFALRPGMAVLGAISVAAVRGLRVPTTAFTDDSHDQPADGRHSDDTIHVREGRRRSRAPARTSVVDGRAERRSCRGATARRASATARKSHSR